MKNKSISLALIFLIFITSMVFAQNQNSQANKNFQFINGSWFDGKNSNAKFFIQLKALFPVKTDAH